MTEIPNLLTFKQFSDKHAAFSEGSLRWLRFQTNGAGPSSSKSFRKAFVSRGRRVLVDEQAFFDAVKEENSSSGVGSPS